MTLTTEIEGDLPILDLDPVRIREVLSNLVANALRHTPPGGTVAIGGSAARSEVTLIVRDTGSGIEPALLPPTCSIASSREAVARLGPGPRDRPRPRGGPRRLDLGQLAGSGGTTFRIVLGRPGA